MGRREGKDVVSVEAVVVCGQRYAGGGYFYGGECAGDSARVWREPEIHGHRFGQEMPKRRPRRNPAELEPFGVNCDPWFRAVLLTQGGVTLVATAKQQVFYS